MPEAKTLAQIAAATGVSAFSVRSALGRVAAREQAAAGGGALGGGQRAQPDALGEQDEDGEQQEERLLVLPDPLSRDAERALARFGLLGEGAEPVFAPGPRYPLAGLLLALPALEATGLIGAAREVCRRLKNGYYGLAATLLTLVFLALAGEPRAEGATRIPPAALGRVLGLDRGPGGQDDPPQAGRARRCGQGRGPDPGAGPPPRRGPAGRAGVALR